MRYFTRKSWALAGLALLGLAVVSVRGLGHADPAELASEARTALKSGDWNRAEALLAKLSRQRPPSASDSSLRAELAAGRGHLDEAVRILTAIPETDAQAASARLVASQIENSRHRARQTEALLFESIRLNPRLGRARRALIFLHAMQGRRGEVNTQFRALAELEPLSYDDVFLWTSCFENLWINDKIKSHLEVFLAADPEDRLSRLALIGVLVRSNELESAEELLRPLPGSDPEARVLRARIALARMRLDDLRSILKQGPEDYAGLALLRGYLAVRRNELTVASRQFHIVLRLDSENLEALEALSPVLTKLGDAEGAAVIQQQLDKWRRLRSLLQQSRTFNIRTEKALLTQIGQACEAVGQVPVACAWYRLALAQDPLDSDLQRALFRLRG
jgi:tetratricopeptide (TPR) repeat protein